MIGANLIFKFLYSRRGWVHWGGEGGGGGVVCLGVYSYQSFYLWNRRHGEESALNMKCVFISTGGRLYT